LGPVIDHRSARDVDDVIDRLLGLGDEFEHREQELGVVGEGGPKSGRVVLLGDGRSFRPLRLGVSVSHGGSPFSFSQPGLYQIGG
jgi:hypothetical protein